VLLLWLLLPLLLSGTCRPPTSMSVISLFSPPLPIPMDLSFSLIRCVLQRNVVVVYFPYNALCALSLSAPNPCQIALARWVFRGTGLFVHPAFSLLLSRPERKPPFSFPFHPSPLSPADVDGQTGEFTEVLLQPRTLRALLSQVEFMSVLSRAGFFRLKLPRRRRTPRRFQGLERVQGEVCTAVP